MPQTTNGFVYPASSDHTRIWEHLQNLAESVDVAWPAMRQLDLSGPGAGPISASFTQTTAATLLFVPQFYAYKATAGFVGIGARIGGVTIAGANFYQSGGSSTHNMVAWGLHDVQPGQVTVEFFSTYGITFQSGTNKCLVLGPA